MGASLCLKVFSEAAATALWPATRSASRLAFSVLFAVALMILYLI
jgi:hypothetical protein